MSYKYSEVKLWIRENGESSDRRLLNRIQRTSKFKTLPWFSQMSEISDDDLLRAARELAEGWKMNGPWPYAVFEIEGHRFGMKPVLL